MLKKMMLCALTLMLTLILSVGIAEPENGAWSAEDLKAARAEAWDKYQREAAAQAAEDLYEQEITYGEATMRFTVEVIGEKPEAGYPVYIAMHGGGSDDTPDGNDEQWRQMQTYYNEIDCGIYIAVRGVRDTWDTHFNPESYPLYDRLIQDCILVMEADPNRVYLEGFSAGGDGVYAIAPRMADRFAACNMSSGHPNNVSFLNMRNLPIQLQVGEFDTLYDRHSEAARYDAILNAYQQQYGGFEHRTLVHYDAGHNYDDWGRTPIPVMTDPQAWLERGDRTHTDVDSFPPDYMDAFIRSPLPELVLWDLTTRAGERSVESFYYLSAPRGMDQGLIQARRIPGENRIILDADIAEGDFSVLLNEEMIDFSKPVTFEVNGQAVTLSVVPDPAVLEHTTAERGDPSYQFEAEVSYRALLELAGQE